MAAPGVLYLTQRETDILRERFYKFHGIKARDLHSFRLVIDQYGIPCPLSTEDLQDLIKACAARNRSDSDFLLLEEFIEVFQQLKRKHLEFLALTDREVVEAFVSVGGHEEKTGSVSATILKERVCEFGLQVDIDKLIEEIDEDGSGEVEYNEFQKLMMSISPQSAVVDPVTLFTSLGGNVEEEHSKISLNAIRRALNATAFSRREQIIVGAFLEHLAEKGPDSYNYDEFFDRIFQPCQMLLIYGDEDHENLEKNGKDNENRNAEHSEAMLQRTADLLASSLSALRMNRHSSKKTGSSGLKLEDKLLKVLIEYNMKQTSNLQCTMPPGLAHLRELDIGALETCLMKPGRSNHRLWGAVKKAVTLMKAHLGCEWCEAINSLSNHRRPSNLSSPKKVKSSRRNWGDTASIPSPPRPVPPSSRRGTVNSVSPRGRRHYSTSRSHQGSSPRRALPATTEEHAKGGSFAPRCAISQTEEDVVLAIYRCCVRRAEKERVANLRSQRSPRRQKF